MFPGHIGSPARLLGGTCRRYVSRDAPTSSLTLLSHPHVRAAPPARAILLSPDPEPDAGEVNRGDLRVHIDEGRP